MDTRTRIVETAAKLFYSQGYNSTGINQLIKEAGVAKASLYQHFPSKEDLLVEYLRVTAIDTNKILAEVIAKPKTPQDKVLAMFDFLIAFSKQTSYNGCNFLNVAAELPQEHEDVKSMIKTQKNHVRNLFAEILRPIGKEKLADELYVLFDAALVTSKVYGADWPIETTKTIAQKLL